MARQREKKTASTAWLERYNPLNGLSIAQAKQIFDAARSGDTQRLHWLYQEIETQNPVLSMCVTRRSGAAAGFNWSVAERASKNSSLSQEQKDAAETFLADIENFADLFEHLDLALFRGFAHAQPIWEGDAVHHIELLDSWKFLKKDGDWLYNPVCDGFSSNCISCEHARLVTVERRRPVDVPALAIHIRAAVGERDWGRFLERYALPKPAITMAPNATKEDREDYLVSGEGLENGQVSVWPNGTSITDFAGGSRGVDPFSVFITHQEKTILMLATGGTLGSMAESGAGTLAGNAQQDVWESIVLRDSGIIAAAVQRSLLRPFLAAKFPGQPVCVDFVFDLTQKPTPKEIFETAAAARNAGYLVDQAELEEATGFTLKPDQAPAPQPGFALNKKEPGKSVAKGRPVGLAKIAAAILDGSVTLEEGLKRAQTELDAATLESLSGNLQQALEDAMYLAALESLDRSGDRSGDLQVANSITNPCPKCHRQMSKEGTCSFCAKRAANHNAGKAAFENVAQSHHDVIGAMERDSIGKIDFIWGDDSEGVKHILKKHKATANQIPGVIAYGDLYESKRENKYYIIKKRYVVILRKREGSNHYLISGFKADSPDYAAAIRKESKLVEKGE